MMTNIVLAYLDPGSGSALVGTLFALVGALAFSMKSLFYRVFLGKKVEEEKPNENLAIFTEGKSYWGTFKPIVDELIRRKIPFSYYTMDVHDPGLTLAYDSQYMFARLFDKDKITSFKKLSQIRAKILLATTPNIGCPGYPLARPKNVERLVHVFHDPLGDFTTYRKRGLDFYDEILTVSPENEAPLRQLERKRGLPEKIVTLAGAPYLDAYIANLSRTSGEKREKADPTVLVACSWGTKSLFKVYGHEFVKNLLRAGFSVIVRPHPQSYASERNFIEKIERDVLSWGGKWDRDRDGTKSMKEADIMVSDVSGVRMDFAYLFEKPVISMKIPSSGISDFERDDLEGTIWTDAIGSSLGIELSSIDNLVSETLRLTSEKASTAELVRKFRHANCANFGHAASAVIDRLQIILES